MNPAIDDATDEVIEQISEAAQALIDPANAMPAEFRVAAIAQNRGTALFRNQHGRLGDMLSRARRLTAFVGTEPAAHAKEIRTLLTIFGGCLVAHLDSEDSLIHRRLREDPKGRLISEQYEREAVTLRSAFSRVEHDFPTASSVLRNLRGMGDSLQSLSVVMDGLFKQEERELFPEYERLVARGY